MKRIFNLLKLTVVTIIVFSIFVGCTSSGKTVESTDVTSSAYDSETSNVEKEAEDTPKEQVLKYGSDTEPAGFDPHTISETASLRVINQLYETLVEMSTDMSIKSGLAESWEISDEVNYVFTLKKGVKFHNGREMIAEDIKYSFDRILGKTDAGDIGALGNKSAYYGGIVSIEVLNDYQVKFTLDKPNAAFLGSLSSNYGAIVCREVVEENGDLMRADGGTGPFVFSEWKPDNYVSVVKFSEYHTEGEPTLDGITFYLIGDEAARLAALRTGDIHVTNLSSLNLDAVKDNKEIDVKAYQTNNYTFLGMNLSNPALADVRVRQAISLALDRQAIIDYVYNGHAKPSSFVAPGMGHWVLDPTQSGLYTRDLDRAKALLSEAGYQDGLNLVCVAGLSDEIRNQAVVIQQQLAEIGITIEINNMETATYVDTWKKMSTKDVGVDLMSGFNGSGTDPNRAVKFFFSSEGGANVWGYKNARVDELCNLAIATSDVSKRETYYNEAQQIILDECPNVFIASPIMYVFVRAEIEGYNPSLVDGLNFNNTVIK